MSNFVYFQKCACVSVSMARLGGMCSVCVCVSARVGDGLSSSCRRQRQRSLTKFRVRRLLRPRKVARLAGGQADRVGHPLAGNYIFTWCTVEWGAGRARQGGVADVAAKVTQSYRGSAKSERERRSLRLVLGPFRTLTHCRRVGRQWQWQRQGQWRWQGQALGEGWRVSLVVLKLRVAGSLASLWGLTDSAWFVAC